MKLRERLSRDLSVVVEAPFVVVGNGGPLAVKRSAEHTVRWAVHHLSSDFFSRPPLRILDVWLLGDAESYGRVTRTLTGSDPSTPYGFYTREHRALVMNIATGGGTLVHEIVHPFIEANFPGCPAWFNEGLGSLFEQSAERDGHIVGLTNWRLRGLQNAIRKGRVPGFEALTATSDSEFYADETGVHYAAARYLLYYLQERDLLRRYYRDFVAAHARDPSGFATLSSVLGEREMKGFQKRWEAWVLSLRFES
jgi:hypothetical protein